MKFQMLKKDEKSMCYQIQFNKYETAPNIIQLNQNLTSDFFVEFAEFTCFYQFLRDLLQKLYFFLFAEQLYEHIMQKRVNPQKSTVRCQVLVSLNKLWSCLIVIKL